MMERETDHYGDSYDLDATLKRLMQLWLIVLVIVLGWGLGVVDAAGEVFKPYTETQCLEVDFESISLEDIREQWWVHLREYPQTRRSLEAYDRFKRYRYYVGEFDYNGVQFAVSMPAWTVDNRFDSYILYAGIYWGVEGNPHPSCGVWSVDKHQACQMIGYITMNCRVNGSRNG